MRTELVRRQRNPGRLDPLAAGPGVYEPIELDIRDHRLREHRQRSQHRLGGRIRLKGTSYERGIGTHANSKIVYDLKGLGRTYARFVSDVGIDGDQQGSVVFQVFADEKKVFDSQLMTAASPTRKMTCQRRGRETAHVIGTCRRRGHQQRPCQRLVRLVAK